MRNERKNALDKKFHALSNQTRREILMQLNQKPHSAGEIAGYFQITPASISYHLSLLLKKMCIRDSLELTDSALKKLSAMTDEAFAELELYPDFDSEDNAYDE